ncbi:hypothetical protein NE236_32660 [Actinoallomurus purpureus]|uniref:hypothetical protein n=1 Tax=Actinoallomurus purpureus TaxID=478114 RepID=UPI00209296C7|nr:hypothetical protein [Actinoallomurus purpureus]MCO6009734.1 hypothetical protein [Actinoallomurus purpureus]
MTRIDGPFYRVSDPAFELTVVRWKGYDPEALEEADGHIHLPDGTHYAPTFMTLRTVSAIMDRWQTSGECLNGEYFWCSDLIIIRNPGLPAIVEVVRHLIATGEVHSICSPLEAETPGR